MKKSSSQHFNEKYDNIELSKGESYLGKKKERRFIQNDNGKNMNLKNEREIIYKEIDNYKKLNEKSDNSEKGFKIIMSDVQDGEDEIIRFEKADNIINLKKKKKRELKILDKKKLKIEESKFESENKEKADKKKSKVKKKESISSESNLEIELILESENASKNKSNKKKDTYIDSPKIIDESLSERTDTLIETNLSSKTKSKKEKTKLQETIDRDNFFSQDFIKIPKENFTQVDKPEVELKVKDKKQIKIDSGNFYPWLSKEAKRQRGMLKLHQEIIDFYEFIKPAEAEDQLRERTVKIIKNLVQTEWPTWIVKEFGSFPCKIHLPDSDVDILVLTGKDSSADQYKILKKITKVLVDADCVDYIQLINARVPIIKATLKETKINLDISANRKNGYEAKKVVKSTLEDFPFMRPIIYVLKYFLRQRKLNESYTGGISSFLLFNLLLAYVQYLAKEDEGIGKKSNLGDILVGFLQFYGFDFNFEDIGISVRYGGYFYKKSDSSSQGFKPNVLLSVENFQELDQDIGKSAFKFRKILNCFKQARDALYYPSKFPLESYLGQFIDVDRFLIDRYVDIK